MKISNLKPLPKIKKWTRIISGKERHQKHRILDELEKFFERKQVPYRLIPHFPVYNPADLAELLNVSQTRVAKVVGVEIDDRFAIAVIPSYRTFDLAGFSELTGARHVGLATEGKMKGLFPDCEVGAEPPLGNLYGIDVYVDELLVQACEIIFEAGSHRLAIGMKYKDFEALVRPKIGRISYEKIDLDTSYW